VRKVQPANVHSKAKKVPHRRLGVARRTNRADDLGAAGTGDAV